MTKASAPGKIILFGEHAVVYGRPAIAVPVFEVRAQVTVEPKRGQVEIDAADIARRYDLRDAPVDDPLATIIERTCARLGVPPQDFSVHIHSTIPVARGLGSGAAVSVAIARALDKYFSTGGIEKRKPRPDSVSPVARLSNEDISALAYEVEKLHHGIPSGIDNTVIAFEQPVYFVKGQPIESFRISRPFTIAIADTGMESPTKIAVGDVHRAWQADRSRYETLFDGIGAIVHDARSAIERGDLDALGPLMNANQQFARELGVSSPEIERLINAASHAGARGAKLSGAGRGGNVIVLVDQENRDQVGRALLEASAKRVIVTTVE